MKKNKGFTLIELLAVIVVLAIIALIATPIVMNTIKNTKKGATERGVVNYIRQVELTIATEELNKHYVSSGTYTINSDGDICLNNDCSDKLIIEMNGTKPDGGIVVIEDNEVKKESYIKIGDYYVQYNNDKGNYVADLEYQGILCTKQAE